MYAVNYKITTSVVVGLIMTVVALPNAFFWAIGIVMFIAGAFTGEGYPISYLVISALISGIGWWIVIKGWKKVKLGRDCTRYAAVLAASSPKSFFALGRAVGHTPQRVGKNLDRMIECGMLERISINEFDGTIQYVQTSVPDNMSPPEPVNSPARCHSCGAPTVIPRGKVGVCQYCGSRIKAE